MREPVREFIDGLSREEQAELVHTLVARWAPGVEDERCFVDPDGVVVGYFVPFANWIRTHPMAAPVYKTQEEATEAAKNGRSLSEICAHFNAMYPPDATPLVDQ